MAQYRKLATPHPEWADFPNNLPLDTRRTPHMSRDRFPITPHEGLKIEEFGVPARDGYPIRARSYRQSSLETEPLPLLIYLHGGGFVTGGLETDDSSCRAIAEQIPIVVLNVEYRLAPEHKFPVGFQDSFDVVKWAASAPGQKQLSTDLTKGFMLGGTSAGANFTGGISHLARDENLSPSLTGLLFMAPSFCHPEARPERYRDRILSIDEIDDAPGLTRTSIDRFAGLYEAPPHDLRLSPLLFESHANLAQRAVFHICGWDPRRDEALLFEELLKENGMETKKFVYEGLPHGFWTTCPDLPVTRQWLVDLIQGVQFLLASQ